MFGFASYARCYPRLYHDAGMRHVLPSLLFYFSRVIVFFSVTIVAFYITLLFKRNGLENTIDTRHKCQLLAKSRSSARNLFHLFFQDELTSQTIKYVEIRPIEDSNMVQTNSNWHCGMLWRSNMVHPKNFSRFGVECLNGSQLRLQKQYSMFLASLSIKGNTFYFVLRSI